MKDNFTFNIKGHRITISTKRFIFSIVILSLLLLLSLVLFVKWLSSVGEDPPVLQKRELIIKKVKNKKEKETITDNPLNRERTDPYPVLFLPKETLGYQKRPSKNSKTSVMAKEWYGGRNFTPIIRAKTIDKQQWFKVMTKKRPNESRLWVPFSPDKGMKVYMGQDILKLNLKKRTFKRYRQGRLILKTKVIVGKGSTPTPKGKFFITHRSVPPSPAYGPFMLVTNAHSEAMKTFGGIDDAIVAIHGPIDTSDTVISDGAALSHGCIRLKMRDLETLEDIQPGTVIDIK